MSEVDPKISEEVKGKSNTVHRNKEFTEKSGAGAGTLRNVPSRRVLFAADVSGAGKERGVAGDDSIGAMEMTCLATAPGKSIFGQLGPISCEERFDEKDRVGRCWSL